MRVKRIKTNAEKTTKLVKALESGGKIVGLTGYIQLENEDDPVYVKVKVKGMVNDGCNLRVECQIPGGKGTLKISPCQWRDTIADLEKMRAEENRKEKTRNEYATIVRQYTKGRKESALLDYIRKNLNGQSQEFLLDIQARKKENKGRLAEFQIRDIAAGAVLAANGYKPGEAEDIIRGY